MSFASLLSQVRKDKRGTSSAPSVAHISSTPSSSSSSSASSAQAVDPAVSRLKEARRKEKERLEELKKQKKLEKAAADAYMKPRPAPVSAPRGSSIKSSTVATRTNHQKTAALTSIRSNEKTNHTTTPVSRTQKSASPPGPKLSFKELLKQAEKVDAKKLTVNPIIKKSETKSASQAAANSRILSPAALPPSPPTTIAISKPTAAKPVKLVSTKRDNDPYGIRKGKPNEIVQSRFDVKKPIVAPAPFAKPSEKLLKKLEMKRRPQALANQGYRRPNRPSVPIRKERKDAYDIEAADDDDEEDFYEGYDDYDDGVDDFIEYDDDELEERERQQRIRRQGYDRDEIWEIMNPGRSRDAKKRYYDEVDDDDDDMEATGEEIFEEEQRAAKLARLEELREQRLLEQHALEKQKRLKRGK